MIFQTVEFELNTLLLVAVIVTSVAFILALLATALPYWLCAHVSGGSDLYYGLWELCASVNNDDYVCRAFEHAGVDMKAWQEAAGALMIIGLFFIFFALIIAVVALTCLPQILLLYIIGGVCALFAALCTFIAVVVFGAKYDDGNNLDGTDLHAAFYLAIFAMVFDIVSGILIFFSKPKYMSQVD